MTVDVGRGGKVDTRKRRRKSKLGVGIDSVRRPMQGYKEVHEQFIIDKKGLPSLHKS